MEEKKKRSDGGGSGIVWVLLFLNWID